MAKIEINFEPEFNRSEIEDQQEAKLQAQIELGEADREEGYVAKASATWLCSLIRKEFDRQDTTKGTKGEVIDHTVRIMHQSDGSLFKGLRELVKEMIQDEKH